MEVQPEIASTVILTTMHQINLNSANIETKRPDIEHTRKEKTLKDVNLSNANFNILRKGYFVTLA